jgi:hypothetical protein
VKDRRWLLVILFVYAGTAGIALWLKYSDVRFSHSEPEPITTDSLDD